MWSVNTLNSGELAPILQMTFVNILPSLQTVNVDLDLTERFSSGPIWFKPALFKKKAWHRTANQPLC